MKTPDSQQIELRLRELAQLFNSLDPSPFIERDLDSDAEEFISPPPDLTPGQQPSRSTMPEPLP